VVIDEGKWWDLGTREQYLEVHRELAAGDFFGDGREWRMRVDPAARVAGDVAPGGFVAVGADAVIEEGAQVTDCILWEGARVLAGSRLNRCVVTCGRTAAGQHIGVDF
jgi:NDP-sugar pyrophosphorylase family protein